MILSVRRIFFSVLLIGFAQCVASAQNIVVFPQFVTGADYVSTVTLVNTNATTAVTGTLSIFNQDGSPRATAMNGRGTASTFQVNIPAGGTAVLTTIPGGTLLVGLATFTSDFPADGVVNYSYSGGEVGVLPASAHAFQTIPINTANVSTFQVSGTARQEGFSGNYTVTLAGGGNASGTIVMNHSGR